MSPEDRQKLDPEEKCRRHLFFCLLNGRERLLAAAKQALYSGELWGDSRTELQAAVDRCDGIEPEQG